MVHGLCAGMTSYENQNLEQIRIDMENINRKVEDVLKQEESILDRIEEIRKNTRYNRQPIDLYDYLVDVIDFFAFLKNIVRSDNLTVILAIGNNEISLELIDKLKIIGEKAWKFNRKFARSFPDVYLNTNNIYEEELWDIHDDIMYIVTGLMDYSGISERLREFIHEPIEQQMSIESIVIETCSKLISERKLLKDSPSEDDLNKFLSTLLEQHPKLYVKDQTRMGESANGKQMGEIDLLVNHGRESSIIESLKIKHLDKSYIIEHINRLKKYDKLGNKINFIIVYYTGKGFEKFSKRYEELLQNSELNFEHKYIVNKSNRSLDNRKVIEMIDLNSSEHPKIMHVLLNFW